MHPAPYILSFTGASLSLTESVKIAEVYLRLLDWDAVKLEVKGTNLIQARTRSSIQRVYQELQPRLANLSTDLLELLVHADPPEQKHILWYAVCLRYAYIAEFASEVLREKFLRLDFLLSEFDYDAFFNRKADWHPELDSLTAKSRQKIKTRLLRMLLEADLINASYHIFPTTFSFRVKDALAASDPLIYQFFPVPGF